MLMEKCIAPADVVLVQPPFASLARPSIALGLLKSALKGSRLTCAAVYGNLLFAEFVGIQEYLSVKEAGTDMLLGEWVFATAAFPDFAPDDEAYLTQAAARFVGRSAPAGAASPLVSAKLAEWRALRQRAVDFTRHLAEAICAANPRIVGCTSMFEQHAAALALLREVNRLRPGVATIIGGANCAGAMAAATVREFPWVDVAFAGEADDVFPALCEALVSGSGELPRGAVDRRRAEAFEAGELKESDLWAAQAAIDRAPLPDYDEYFATLAAVSYRGRVNPGLVLESSRGCWWRGAKPCAFCSLNPGHRRHRAKPAAKTLKELETLATRHGVSQFEMVDNIVPPNYFEEFFPVLRDAGKSYSLFYETPPILSRCRVRAMAEGGVTWLQSGIEALDDDVLALMNKGSNVLDSIASLKHFAEFGVKTVWHLLTGTPGEQPQWHLRVVNLMPLIHHLPAPFSTAPITFFRHGSYHERPREHGLELSPAPAYSVIYPLDAARAAKLVFLFVDKAQAVPGSFATHTNSPEALTLKRAARIWLQLSKSPNPPILCAADHGGDVHVLDTRGCATARRHFFKGLDAVLIRLLVEPRAVTELPSLAGAPPESVRAALTTLKAARIVLECGGRALALTIPGSSMPPPPSSSFPGGFVHDRDLHADDGGLCSEADER